MDPVDLAHRTLLLAFPDRYLATHDPARQLIVVRSTGHRLWVQGLCHLSAHGLTRRPCHQLYHRLPRQLHGRLYGRQFQP